MPLREYSNWSNRVTDTSEQIEPYRKYYFICEGANTEQFYFKTLIGLRKELKIHPMIDVRYLDKVGKDRNVSDPLSLLRFALESRNTYDYDDERDVLVVVFDADVFEFEKSNFGEVLKLARDYEVQLGVTNPCFELFLLLHIEDSYETMILPHESELLLRENLGEDNLTVHLLREATGMNPKTNRQIGRLAQNVKVAIHQNEKLNSDIAQCHGIVTCNLGPIIQSILDDKAE